MNSPVEAASLKALSLIAPLTDEEAVKLAAAARLGCFSSGDVIFREGDHIRRFWIIDSGTVAIEIVAPDRRLRRLHTVGPGELLGWSPMLGSGAMTATGRALDDVLALEFDADGVSTLCESDPIFGYRLMRNVAKAIASRLNSTRLQLLDAFNAEFPHVSEGAGP